MAASVAVTKVPATQPSNQKLAVHDGKTDSNSPLLSSDPCDPSSDPSSNPSSDPSSNPSSDPSSNPKSNPSDPTAKPDVMSENTPTISGSQQDDLVNSCVSSGGLPMQSGKLATSPTEDVGKNDSALLNGDYNPNQTGTASNNITSCYCPDGSRGKSVPPYKIPRPTPRKPQPRAPPPKLPPKPPHLLHLPSSDNLMGRSNREKDLQSRGQRSQSVSVVSVHNSPQTEDVQETKPVKQPIPKPRKSLPNIFQDLSSSDIKSLQQSGSHSEAPKQNSKMTASSPEALCPKSPSHEQREPLIPTSQSGSNSPVNRHEMMRKKTKTTQHVRVRERAAIFEKLIEVETSKNRDSQISEQRSRTPLSTSDETSISKSSNISGSMSRSRNRLHSYVNIQLHNDSVSPENISQKDASVEDDTVSVASVSSDDLFVSPQSTIKSRPRRPPSPNLSEDEYTEDSRTSNKRSSFTYTDVVLPNDSNLKKTEELNVSRRDTDSTYIVSTDSDAGDSGYTDVIIPDSVSLHNNQKVNLPHLNSTVLILKSNAKTQGDHDVQDTELLQESEKSKTSYRESDYSDVVVPDSVLPEVALNTAEPRFSLPIEQKSTDTSDAAQLERHDMISPDHALPKPFHSAHMYRNVVPSFVMPVRQARSCDKDRGKSGTESTESRLACQQSDDVTKKEVDRHQEGIQMDLADNLASLPQEVRSNDNRQQTGQEPVAKDVKETNEIPNMPPEPRRRELRRKSHPAGRSMQYEVCLPDSINPITLKRKDGIEESGQVLPTTKNEVEGSQGEGSEVVEYQDAELDEEKAEDLPDKEYIEGDGSDMLCNRSRRQRFAVKKRDSNAAGRGRNKWQNDSAPATLAGLERQESITELRTEVTTPPDDNRLSQASSAGSAISSLISNVSIGDADQFTSDEEDYEDVEALSSGAVIPPLSSGADVIPPLPPSPPKHMDGMDTRPLPCEDIVDDDTYSTLYEVRASGPVQQNDNDVLTQRGGNDKEEAGTKDESDRVPVEIEMQPMKLKSPHSTDKEAKRRAYEFHLPLFLRKSNSVESAVSGHYSDNHSSHSLTTHSEDSDASSDCLEELPSLAQHRQLEVRDSIASEDRRSVGSGVSMDSLNLSVQSELQDNLRRSRRKSSERGRPVSEYDRPVSAASMEYNRPVSIASTEYDRPVSSSSADYISVLNSFHKDGKRDKDSEGFSFSWGVEHDENDSYRRKSEELPQSKPVKYALPRKGSNAAKSVPVLPPAYKALKPPKTPRPYSEPSPQKTKRNSVVRNFPVPSQEEIAEQFCKISRQRSRFVSQEPLFQIYQEDARKRESYLRLMNISSLESLAKFLENQQSLKKDKRESEPIAISSQLPEYRVLIPDEEVYRYQSGEECKSGDVANKPRLEDNRISRSGEAQEEAVYQSVEPIYEPPGELFYDTGNILQNNTIYEPGSLGSSAGEGSGGSNSDVEIPKPYGLMERTKVSSAVRRSFWSELPEVISSGLLEQMTSEDKRLQEALFEVITSEASYLRSLNLVVEHFLEDPNIQPPEDLLRKAQNANDQDLPPGTQPSGGQVNKGQAHKEQSSKGLLNKVQHHLLFSNIKSVRDASERLLLDLEERLKDSTRISDVCDILLQHFNKGDFNSYIVYCANHQYQIKTLEELRRNPLFLEVIKDLESKPACCSLDLQSFLMLPFQRITRLPLLIEAIRQQTKLHDPLHSTALEALKALRNMAEKCNEEAKRMEMIEEVTQLANQLDFREGVKKMNLSGTTSIVKRGRIHIIKKDNKLLTRGKLIAKAIYVIIFTDKVAMCKQKIKGEQLKYDVFDWCPRNRVQVEPVDNPQQHPKLPDGVPNNCKNVFIISFLENSLKKEVVFAMDANSEAERERWMDALHPAKKTLDGETIYESWDCPQVLCNQPYGAQDRDELSLDVHDRVDIDKKIDGWYYGTRVSDHAKGWFPANYTQEIINDHVLARNLKQRHRLLSICDQHLWKTKNMRK